jgi:hypothetical protein
MFAISRLKTSNALHNTARSTKALLLEQGEELTLRTVSVPKEHPVRTSFFHVLISTYWCFRRIWSKPFGDGVRVLLCPWSVHQLRVQRFLGRWDSGIPGAARGLWFRSDTNEPDDG